MGFGKGGLGVIIREDQDQAIGTLANRTVLLLGTKLVMAEDFRMLKSELSIVSTGVAVNELDGMMLGIAQGDLSITEIKEALEVSGPTSRGKRAQQEQAERFVKLIGMFVNEGGSEVAVVCYDLETGAPGIRAKPRWTFSNSTGWNFFLYNLGVAPTSGATARMVATHFGVWVT